ncbi:hypothetical protein BDP81DRAFT_422619 [Colletotrichum phormii]|uniref:Uncharacterized protein n=1 Tax=Colletotrichum phormii TaxID=359342 RepID=A0AAI9ZVS2_9PEZI|nr:uncharacterized protein BDP81DRAFT_422619 [Colletotrichum phormii]KAK1638766.1 hypothetical protein BDP81DRAFT_422619 [Colletotrichum phormii]
MENYFRTFPTLLSSAGVVSLVITCWTELWALNYLHTSSRASCELPGLRSNPARSTQKAYLLDTGHDQSDNSQLTRARQRTALAAYGLTPLPPWPTREMVGERWWLLQRYVVMHCPSRTELLVATSAVGFQLVRQVRQV